MFAIVSPEKIHLPPGSLLRMPATWENYQRLCQQRGDNSIPRIKYRTGEVLLMSPLPKHGRDASLIADIIKVLLDFNKLEYDSFTPVTMELPAESGIEPDYCFYIDNWEAASGKERIDWRVDPPPDLVLEIDVTSYTQIDDYLPYRVPEVWLFRQDRLGIYQLQETEYLRSAHSRYFPELDIQQLVIKYRQIAYDRNTSTAIRQLRQQLAQH
ncbi:MAG: Uma2 family endonuclease [Chroococcus sp. CMT-3BRIN-NPC107]|jgi:Uma2 family endonuclease|nr:Uma2 family endonuclease [Chroococcus sp. CMT-3BRIN-NPC107]